MIRSQRNATSAHAAKSQASRASSNSHGRQGNVETQGSLLARFRAVLIAGAFCAAMMAMTSRAATIQLALTCSLNTLDSSGSCGAGPSFGTITLKDLSGVDAGKVEVTIDLGFPSTQKFRDLMLNFAGAATTITDSDSGNTVVLNSNSYSISPYNGDFDLGGTGAQGWNATTAGPYSTVLSGNAPLSTTDFSTLDSLGNLYAAVHILDIGSATGENCDGTGNPACVPGMNGPGSLKIGAPRFVTVPEPSALSLLGIAAMMGCLRTRRRLV